jgi:hypothetical protein
MVFYVARASRPCVSRASCPRRYEHTTNGLHYEPIEANKPFERRQETPCCVLLHTLPVEEVQVSRSDLIVSILEGIGGTLARQVAPAIIAPR